MQPVSRRCLYSLLAVSQLQPLARAQPKLGDQEWMQRFRLFIKAFNEFVYALDDNKLDRAKWTRMCMAWERLQTE